MGELSKDPGAAGGGAVQWAAARWATATRAGGESASVMNGSWHPLAMVRSSLTWRSALYLGVSLAWGLANSWSASSGTPRTMFANATP
ncbi:hypothetical protein AB0C69_07380, partial [Actinomadura sp. NPDC048032]|uniref:hypothetical protein n=1 Tax=Actinomadura sp. NPDC048032 TaxID=3155747 RepID=UPI0033E15578